MGKEKDFDNIYQVVKETILKAGHFILDQFNQPGQYCVSLKQKNDFVTIIDKESEKIIIENLRKNFPNHEILAEESGFSNFGKNDYLWVIDPLDGTTNFIQKIPHFGISIALLKNGTPEFGMIYNPILDELFHAFKGNGCFLNSKKINISNNKKLEDCFGATGFPFKTPQHLTSYTEVFQRLLSRTKGMRRCGAAVLDLAYLACGRYDYFWEAYLEPWDFLAGSILIKEAGGQITDFYQKPLQITPSSVIAANSTIYTQVLAQISTQFSN